MRCDLCRKPISGSFYANPLFGDVACVPCGAESNCRWCGRYRPTKEHYGYASCDNCRKGSLVTEADLNRLRDITMPLITEHFGRQSYGRLPIIFGPTDMHGVTPLGQAWYGTHDNHIRLEQGLPFGFAVGILAHEYGHMLVNLEPDSLTLRPRAGSHHNVIEEGFCEVMCALGLLSQSTDDARWMSFLMPGNPDPVYGDGFRLMWPKAEELGSVAALLETLTGQPHPHRHPLKATVIDEDFTVPDDIAPMVEVGSGDRDKGPLRGTALLTKDLPEDAPKGPRLRGRGLGILERPTSTAGPVVTKGTLRGSGLRTEPTPPTSPATPPAPKGTLRGKGLDKKS
jgi:hypothetical protein